MEMHKKLHDSLTPHAKAAIISKNNEFAAQEKQQTGRLIATQFSLICAITVLCYGYGVVPQICLALWIGGGISILNSCLLAWRMSRADKHAPLEAQQQLRLLFFYAAERFLVVMLLLALAMAMSRLPLAVISGFVAGQAVMMITRLYLQFRIR